MIDLDTLAAYLEDALDAGARVQIEAQLASDPEALRSVVEQRKLDRLLRSTLRPETHKQRAKQSILAAVNGIAPEQLKARVVAEALSPQVAQPESGTTRPIAPSPLRRFIQSWLERFRASAIQRFALGAAAAVVLGVGLFFYFTTAQGPRIEVGRFAAVTGAPTVQHRGQRSTLNPKLSTLVFLGDHIETGDADKVELQFHDGTMLRLNFNTTLEILSPKSPVRHPQSPPSRPSEVKLLRGQIWSKVQKLTNATPFVVQTPVATATVKGTQFGLKLQHAVTPTNSRSVLRPPAFAIPLMAVLTVQEGRVEFSNRFGTVEATDLTESVATDNSAPTAPRRVPSLKAFWITTKYALVRMTSRPSLPEAGYRLVYRGGWVGLDVADVVIGSLGQAANASAISEQVRVVRVQRNSPAERAGVQVGDVILALNGRAITNAWEVTAAIFRQAGTPITLTLASQPGPRFVTLTTTAAPSAPPLPPFSRPAGMALEAASRLLLERRSDEGERALGQLLWSEAGAAAHSNLGLLYETKDELAQALAHYQQAVAAAPQVALYHFNYGLALQNIGNLERAAEELELATWLAPSWDTAFEVLAEVYSPLDRHADALRAVDAALSLNPRSPDLWVSKGRVLTEQGRPQEARPALLKALELEPAYAAACRDLGDLYHHEDQFDEAERLLRKAIEIDPSDVSALSILGNIFGSQGRFAEAEQTLLEVIRRDPAGALTYSNLGYVYRQRGQTADAERMYQKAIELDPDNAIPYTNLGELYRRLGRLDEAERMLRTGIDLDPQNVTAINNLGGLYQYNRHQYDEAEKIYRRVIELDPTYTYAFGNLGRLYWERGNRDEAEKTYRKAVELNPSYADGYASLGYMVKTRGQLDEAEKMYRKALELDPNLVAACNGLAGLLANAGTGLDEALALAQRALKTATNNPAFLDTLGWVRFQRGELPEAEATLKQALELAGENPPASEIREHLKKVAEKKGTPPK